MTCLSLHNQKIIAIFNLWFWVEVHPYMWHTKPRCRHNKTIARETSRTYVHARQTDILHDLMKIIIRSTKYLYNNKINHVNYHKKQPGTTWPHYNVCPHIVRSVWSTRLLCWVLRTYTVVYNVDITHTSGNLYLFTKDNVHKQKTPDLTYFF